MKSKNQILVFLLLSTLWKDTYSMILSARTKLKNKNFESLESSAFPKEIRSHTIPLLDKKSDLNSPPERNLVQIEESKNPMVVSSYMTAADFMVTNYL